MKNKLDVISEEILSQLEFSEAGLLSWGFIGGTFDAIDEIEKMLRKPPTTRIKELWDEVLREGTTVKNIEQNLLDRMLIFKNKEGKSRTRFAETIRLIYLLKQRFKFDDWHSAGNLVSNIKLLLKYRRYPKRDKTIDYVIKRFIEKNINDEFLIKVLYLLLNNGEMKLGKFQVDSTVNLLWNMKSNNDSATIIGAGTGSGKTKAFYIPVLTFITKSIRSDDSYWARILAIYPRTELLKDQFKESIAEVQKLNEFMKNNNLRQISVGAYYGDTPKSAKDVAESSYYEWEQKGNGYVCPYFNCPECGSELIWNKEDQLKEVDSNNRGIYGEHEALHCIKCSFLVSGKNVQLTRDRMKNTPPDIVFTTTEMLNRKLFNASDWHIFGVNSQKIPKFVLLDEVHIYDGVTGAQVAYLLRRWRNLVRIYSKWSSVQFVGLSATLTDPKYFFSTLVGIPEGNTEYITPDEEELTDESMEYNIILRGDPMSEISLLSTTVQTTMLLARMLDPLKEGNYEGVFGPKVFGFTDKLDVINRWYHIEIDAEKNKTLSQYRDSSVIKRVRPNLENTINQQIALGQIWNVAKKIDKDSLTTPLRVGITSSQKKGVDPKAKLVIATSTLEVGYNDERVGTVIQHKAPRSIASFLQRKGRGGRSRGMRPWTIVVTSAYGRDRWVYDNPQMLFDAAVPKLNLPIRNTYVKHVQASFALMDWITLNLNKKGFRYANVWYILSPKSRGSYIEHKKAIVDMLTNVLMGDYSNIAKFIGDSLNLNETSINNVLWLPPRSIMLNLIPSLIAALKTDWSRVIEKGKIVCNDKSNLEDVPLSGFIPSNLFSSLEESDILLMVPGKEELESLGLRQGMVEFAPGNVSKRYAILNRLSSAHWIPIPKDNETVDLGNFDNMKSEYIDNIMDEDGEVIVLRPKFLKLESIPKDITDRTSSHFKWNVDLRPNKLGYSINNRGKEIKLLKNSLLNDVIDSIEVFSSDNSQYILCTRYAKKINTVIKRKQGQGVTTEKKKITFEYNKVQAAIGFQGYVDGIIVKYKTPDLRRLMEVDNWDEILRGLRSEYYLYLLSKDEYLGEILSIFEIEWLWQICMSSVIAISISMNIEIDIAIEKYKNSLIPISKRTLEAIFQTINVPDYESDEGEDGKLHTRLMGYLSEKSISDILLSKSQNLISDISSEDIFWGWVKERYISTLASVCKITLDNISPDMNTEDLVVDIYDEAIWITEPDSGGMGIISSVAQSIKNYPRKFEEIFRNAASHCSRHEMSMDLDAIVENIDLLSLNFQNIRMSSNNEEQKKNLMSLQKNIFDIGIAPKRELVVSIATKMLNVNSSIETDKLLEKVNKIWKDEQIRLGCNFDFRIFAVSSIKIESIKEDIDVILNKIDQSSRNIEIGEKQRFSLVESMMWSDCLDSCPDCIQIYSPYNTFVKPSRLILLALIKTDYEETSYYEDSWKEKLIENLIKGIKSRIWFNYEDVMECRREILNFINIPVEVEFELLYPYIDGVKISDIKCYIDVALREGLHA
jgi:hypothetical protein